MALFLGDGDLSRFVIFARSENQRCINRVLSGSVWQQPMAGMCTFPFRLFTKTRNFESEMKFML